MLIKNVSSALVATLVAGSLLGGSLGISRAAYPAGSLSDQIHTLQVRVSRLEGSLRQLASGQTLTGDVAIGFTAQGSGEIQGHAVTFRTPLATAPGRVEFGPSADCPGVGAASPGVLCLYRTWSYGTANATTYSMTGPGADSNGFYFRATASTSGYVWWLGSFAYTAP